MSPPAGLDPEGPDLTATEVAARLRVHRETITRYIAAGLFPGSYRMKGGTRGQWRIPQTAVIAFIERDQQ